MIIMRYWLIALVFAASSFAPDVSSAPVSVWHEGYTSGVDASVGCPDIPVNSTDISVVKSLDVLTVSANIQRKPGLFSNAIAGTQLEQIPGVYSVTGEFRWPAGYQNESQDINLQWVEGYTEWYSEIFISLNRQSPLYGWVWTRNSHVRGEEILLFKIPVDNKWHSFELVSDHIHHVTKSIRVDDNYIKLNLPMGTVAKEWGKSFSVLLESTNKYTNCSSFVNTTGASEFRNVAVTLRPLLSSPPPCCSPR